MKNIKIFAQRSRGCGNYLESSGRGPENLNKDFCLSLRLLDVHYLFPVILFARLLFTLKKFSPKGSLKWPASWWGVSV